MLRPNLALALPLLAACAIGLAACGDRPPSEAPAPVVPGVPDTDPRPSGPGKFANIENYTAKEKKARTNRLRPGTAVVRLVDAGTGEPVVDGYYYGLTFALTREDCDRRLPIEVSHRMVGDAADGVRRIDLAAGWWRLRFESDDHRATWTPRFEVREGETTELTLKMKLSNRLRVRVLTPDGSPLAKGTLSMRGDEFKGALVIRDGVGETLVDLDELTVTVNHIYDTMTPYELVSVPVRLRYGETTEIEFRLKAR